MQGAIYDAVIQIVQVKRHRESRQPSARNLRKSRSIKGLRISSLPPFFGLATLIYSSRLFHLPAYSFKKSQNHGLLQNFGIGGLGCLPGFCLSTWAGLRPPADQEIFRDSRRGRRRDFVHLVLRRDNGAVPRPDSTRSRNKLGPIRWHLPAPVSRADSYPCHTHEPN